MEVNVNTKLTHDRVLDLVRKTRNDLIKDFLDDRHLREYVSAQFGVRELSNIKVEFIRRDLKALLISPVNENHYEPLINQIKMENTSTEEINEQIFHKELENIFKRYMYE